MAGCPNFGHFTLAFQNILSVSERCGGLCMRGVRVHIPRVGVYPVLRPPWGRGGPAPAQGRKAGQSSSRSQVIFYSRILHHIGHAQMLVRFFASTHGLLLQK